MNQAPDQYLTTKPVSKQMTMEEVFSNAKRKPREEEYDIVPNPNKKKPEEKKRSKKKMALDSDEQEDDDQFSEYEDGDE